MSQPDPTPLPLPGSQYLAEIREQPAALRRLLEHRAEFARVAAEAAKRGPGIVRMVGHGSSDNAASFGVYAFGLLPGLTAARDSISLLVYYGAKIDLGGSVVVALSQSGRTPDVLEYVFVAATASSAPASSGSTASASCASSESGSLVTAIVNAPPRRARATYSSTSGVRPDCDSATTTEPPRSILAP